MRDRSGNNSERGKFVNGVEDFNRSNRNTASLMINQRAASGTTPASEDLSVTLLQTGAVTTKEMQERRKGLAAQLRTSSMISEADMKAREADSNIFVIKDITPAKFRQVQNAINAIRDSRDAAPPPVSSGPSGSTSGSPSGGPSGAPAPGTPEDKAKAEAAKTRKESVENARLVVIPLIQGRLGLLNSSADQLALRKAVEAKIAELNSACGLPEGDAGTKQIRERTEELQKLGQDIDKIVEQGKKDTETVRKNATTELERGQKMQTDNGAVLPENMRKRLAGNIEQLAAVTDPPQETAIIQKNLKVLTVTLARIVEMLPSYQQSAKAIEVARKTPTTGMPPELIKVGEANIKALEDARNADNATPLTIQEAMKVLGNTKGDFEAEQKEKEIQDKLRKRATDAKTRVQTLHKALVDQGENSSNDMATWNQKLATERSETVEALTKTVRLSAEQVKQLTECTEGLETMAKTLDGITKARAAANKQTEADNKRTETNNKNTTARRTLGRAAITTTSNYGAGIAAANIVNRGSDMYDIDIDGYNGDVDIVVLKWNASNKRWETGLTSTWNQTPPNWGDVHTDYASGTSSRRMRRIYNDSGRNQANAILGVLRTIENENPITT